nr:MAG TPA: hypothetical protein [Caudoviricetes sp.]
MILFSYKEAELKTPLFLCHYKYYPHICSAKQS